MLKWTLLLLALTPNLALAQDDAIVVEPQPRQTISMTLGLSNAIRTSRPYRQVNIVDPAVVDALPESDRRINLVPRAPGITSVTIYDENNVQISAFSITVSRATERIPGQARENFQDIPGRVKIHNHPNKLAGVTVYGCASGQCELVREIQSELPSPTVVPRNQNNITIGGVPFGSPFGVPPLGY